MTNRNVIRPLANEFIVVCESPYPEEVFCYSPGICRCPDGRLVATMDFGGPGTGKLGSVRSTVGDYQAGNSGRCFLSDDHGASWRKVLDFPFYHARPFVAGNALYILGHSWDLMIVRSDDWGETWSEPVRFTEGQHWHQAPCNVCYANGKIYLVMNFSFEERKLLMETLSRVATGGKVLCVNIGGLPEPETLELANLFRRHPFTVAAVTAPEPVTDTPEELIEAIAPVAATGIPFSVYWTPMIPKSKPSFRSVEALMRFPNFVGLKDSSRDMVNFTTIATAFGGEISVFQGVEMLHLASLAVGSAGMVGGGLNFYPGLAAGVTEHFRRGDLDAARALQLKMNRA